MDAATQLEVMIRKMRVVCDAAETIVALWKSPQITGLPRSERNAAIEDCRAALIVAVEDLK
jgi:hypothetical protein